MQRNDTRRIKVNNFITRCKTKELPSWDLRNWSPEQLKECANLSRTATEQGTKEQEDILSK